MMHLSKMLCYDFAPHQKSLQAHLNGKTSDQHYGETLIKSSWSDNLLGGPHVGGWVEGWDPGCGGPWRSDSFELGRYYEGEWEGVQTPDKLCTAVFQEQNIFNCLCSAVHRLKTSLLCS